MSQLQGMSNIGFADYLDRVADDYEESGSDATAEDYREAATRIREIEFLEAGAYQAGMVDGVAKGGC